MEVINVTPEPETKTPTIPLQEIVEKIQELHLDDLYGMDKEVSAILSPVRQQLLILADKAEY